MTLDQAINCLGRTVLFEWTTRYPIYSSGGGPPDEDIVEESAVAYIVRIDGEYVISDEGLGFRWKDMRARLAIAGVDYK